MPPTPTPTPVDCAPRGTILEGAACAGCGGKVRLVETPTLRATMCLSCGSECVHNGGRTPPRQSEALFSLDAEVRLERAAASAWGVEEFRAGGA